MTFRQYRPPRRFRPEIESHIARQGRTVTARFSLRFADGVLDGLLDPKTHRIVLPSTFFNALGCDEHKRLVLRLPLPDGKEIIIADGEVTNRDDAVVLINHLQRLGCIHEV